MNEIVELINGVDLSAAQITETLSSIGNGSMLDGINSIYSVGFQVGRESGYRERLIEEVREKAEGIDWEKVTIACAAAAVGAGVAATGIYLYNKYRRNNTEPLQVCSADDEVNMDENSVIDENEIK